MPITRTRTLFLAPEDDCHAALLATAQMARVSIHAMIFGFTLPDLAEILVQKHQEGLRTGVVADRKSTRLNSSHTVISYAVFCLKKKKKKKTPSKEQKWSDK